MDQNCFAGTFLPWQFFFCLNHRQAHAMLHVHKTREVCLTIFKHCCDRVIIWFKIKNMHSILSGLIFLAPSDLSPGACNASRS